MNREKEYKPKQRRYEDTQMNKTHKFIVSKSAQQEGVEISLVRLKGNSGHSCPREETEDTTIVITWASEETTQSCLLLLPLVSC